MSSVTVLLTKDEDFPHRFHQSIRTPVVASLRVGNVGRQALLRWLRPLLLQVIKLI
jgi:predicted nuclease of predicted toxin-antitoxin system